MISSLSFNHKLSSAEALARMRETFRELQKDIPARIGTVQEGWVVNGGFLRLSGELVNFVAVITLPKPGQLDLFMFASFPGDKLLWKKTEKILREAIEEQLSY